MTIVTLFRHTLSQPVKASTEEFLYILLWTAETIARPTWRNMTDSFESWAWRSRLSRRLAELEKQKLLERAPAPAAQAIVRLTELGKSAALGGRNPIQQWQRPWDGRWRMVLFDVPETRREVRIRFWRYLRRCGFGYLQNSVWITPDSLETARAVIQSESVDTGALMLMEGRPCGGETDEHIVGGAWDFSAINSRYELLIDHLKKPPTRNANGSVRGWQQRERELWNRAVHRDPLLPRTLLPASYLGETAWKLRCRILPDIARQLISSAP